MTKIVGIMASPRDGGNTDILLEKALEGARSAGAAAEKIVLNDLDFRPCQECGGCGRTGVCIIEDSLKGVYKAIEDSDGVIVASPVFFGSVSAQAKMLIDRFQCLWVKRFVLKKARRRRKRRRGLFLCVSASGKADFLRNSRSVVKAFFATLDIAYSGELFCRRAENRGDLVNKDRQGLRKAFDLGAALAHGKDI